MSVARFKPQAEPPTPPSGYMFLFCDVADGLLYYKLDTGTVLPVKPVGAGTGDLLSDGTVPLSANWDIGAYKIIALQLESDATTGTAPLVIASTTLVSNLNAELHGGKTLATIESEYAAAIAAAVTGLWDDKGAYDADTNSPDLDTSPSGIKQSDAYTVSVAGTFFTEAVEVGDMLVAKQDDPTTLAHWSIYQANLNAASIKALYESNADTNALTDALLALVNGSLQKSGGTMTGGIVHATGQTFLQEVYTFDIPIVADGDYELWLYAPFACTITDVGGVCDSGTCTMTLKIGATPLGGTANSVSSTYAEQAHASANAVSKGSLVLVTISANSSCINLQGSVYMTRPKA